MKNRARKKKISGCFETLTKPTNALKDNVIVPLISTTVFRVFYDQYIFKPDSLCKLSQYVLVHSCDGC